MSTKTITIVGIYDTLEHASAAVKQFTNEGFLPTDISLLRLSGAADSPPKPQSLEVSGKGIAPGGIMGGALGLFAGFGILATGGAALAPLVVAGVGGALGSLIGSLASMGISEHEAIRYESQVKEGGVLVAIHCTDLRSVSRAQTIFEKTGAVNIQSGEAAAKKEAAAAP